MPDQGTTGKLVAVADGPPPFTKTEARKFTDSIRADLTALWEKIVEAHDRQAWAALGYETFTDYVHEEFGWAKAHAYRVLNAGQVIAELSPPPAPVESPIGDWRAEQAEHDRERQIKVVTRYFPNDSAVPLPTRLAQTNELKPLMHDGEAMREIWHRVVEQHGPNPTGRQVREFVVVRREELKRPEERLPGNLRDVDNWIGDVESSLMFVPELLSGDIEHPEDGLLSDAPPEFLDQWRTDLQQAQETIGQALRRLMAVS
jgi:hypothetical protein